MPRGVIICTLGTLCLLTGSATAADRDVRITRDGNAVLLSTGDVFRVRDRISSDQLRRRLQGKEVQAVVYMGRDSEIAIKDGERTILLLQYMVDSDEIYRIRTMDAKWVTDDGFTNDTTIDEATKKYEMSCGYGREPSCSLPRRKGRLMSFGISDLCEKLETFLGIEGDVRIKNSEFGCGILNEVMLGD